MKCFTADVKRGLIGTGMSRPAPSCRADFRWFSRITMRWSDNDVFGHVNNVVYYSWFDTAVNQFLIERGLLEVASSEVVGVVVENGCRYHREIAYPGEVELGLRVDRLGTSSVRYAIGVFHEGETTASADGHFVHVYVTRATMRPVPIPEATRREMRSIAAASDTEITSASEALGMAEAGPTQEP